MKVVAERAFCPQCKSYSLKISEDRIEEFFPEGIMEILYHCSNCSYKATDVYPLKAGKPTRLTLAVGEHELSARIAKSSTATIKIPELGAEIAPGPASDGYISNVEGILERLEDKFPKLKKKFEELRAKGGFTLIIEDPYGTSAVESSKVKKEQLS